MSKTDEQKAADAVATSVDEVQKIADTQEEQGFSGVKVDPLPNSAYSLESGPDSPTAAEQRAAVAAEQGGDRA